MLTLAQIYPRYASPACWGDKGTIHSYIEVYEQLLAPYRIAAKRVLEIGILTGASLRMWEDYFPNAVVHGVDLNDHPLDMADLRPMIAEGTHHIHLMNATDPAEVEQHFGGMTFDVVIEDASHLFEHQLAIYANFKAKMAFDSIYIIEDIEDIDKTGPEFSKIDAAKPVRIFDRRKIKGRFDDVLVVIGGKDV